MRKLKLLLVALLTMAMCLFAGCGFYEFEPITDPFGQFEFDSFGQFGFDSLLTISEDGYWIINGQKTEKKAIGVDGKDGNGIKSIALLTSVENVDVYLITFSDNTTTTLNITNGKDGVTPTVEISEDGYWVINGETTSTKAVGVDGQNGTNGTNGQDGKDGKDGKDGADGNGIVSVVINDKGELVITFDDETSVNLGQIKNVHSHEIALKEIVEREPNCTQVGIKYYVCETCGELIRTVMTEQNADNHICDETGRCTLCGKQVFTVFTVTSPSTFAESVAEVKDGDVIKLPASQSAYTLPSVIAGKEVTIEGTGSEPVEIARNTAQGLPSSKLSFKNVTLVGGPKGSNYIGLQHTDTEEYIGCKFTGITFFYANTITFTDCVFEQSTYEYCFWTYGSKNMTFNNCTFNTQGKAAKVYNENADDEFNITFNDCTFVAPDGNTNNKPAIAINSLGATFNVTINRCTANNYNCNDDAMETWYTTRMPSASDACKKLVGAEGQLDKIHVTIDGTEY